MRVYLLAYLLAPPAPPHHLLHYADPQVTMGETPENVEVPSFAHGERALLLRWMGDNNSFYMNIRDDVTTISNIKHKLCRVAAFEEWRIQIVHDTHILEDSSVVTADMLELHLVVQSKSGWEIKLFAELTAEERTELTGCQEGLTDDIECACFYGCRGKLLAVYGLKDSDGESETVGVDCGCDCGGNVGITLLKGHVLEAEHTGVNHKQAARIRELEAAAAATAAATAAQLADKDTEVNSLRRRLAWMRRTTHLKVKKETKKAKEGKLLETACDPQEAAQLLEALMRRSAGGSSSSSGQR
jgi:hypothetical protein